MKIEFSPDDLRPLVELAVTEALGQLEADRAKVNGRLSYRESEAAQVLGVSPTTLRDARYRGELQGSKVGRYVVYSREELLDFLRRSRIS